jgi:hypothetical protein
MQDSVPVLSRHHQLGRNQQTQAETEGTGNGRFPLSSQTHHSEDDNPKIVAKAESQWSERIARQSP